MVAGFQLTQALVSLTYLSVVSRYSVRISLTISALNGLKLLACKIQNAFLTSKCREKLYTGAGPEFGLDRGKMMFITHALYGLKKISASFRSYLAKTLYELGYTPTKGDPDIWLLKSVKADGFQYYEMVLCYVYDVICISDYPMKTMKVIQCTFKLKDDKINEPKDYLCATLEKMILSDGSQLWSISSAKYVK